ncbi:MAG: extensin family protein [Myxococcota bacterium]|nr:extensin family protein [Myxococcota bacterium]
MKILHFFSLEKLLLCAILSFPTVACQGQLGTIGTYQFGDDPSQARVFVPSEDAAPAQDGGVSNDAPGDGNTAASQDMIIEESEMEDPDALAALIRDRMTESADEAVLQTRPGSLDAPTAIENWRLSPQACLAQLKRHKVPFTKPTFPTPLVQTPLLLTGPIDGVHIAPRFAKSKKVNAVMDCHLVLALVAVAQQAKSQGIQRIEFYSTYRPLTRPPKKCRRKPASARCRRLQRAYRKAAKNPSQHRLALAIDIRWLTTEDNRTIDVLTHFDRRARRDPCKYRTSTEEGALLQTFACELHRHRIFNVMLTPNANKAHHNHFHFDISKKATWYIIN